MKKGKDPDAQVEIFTGEGVEPYPVRVHSVVLGISGELYTTLGWTIQEASPARHICIVNHDACLMTTWTTRPSPAARTICPATLSPAREIPPKDSLTALTKELFEENGIFNIRIKKAKGTVPLASLIQNRRENGNLTSN